jgi:hypothetical protein
MRHYIIIAVLFLGVLFYSCTNQYDPEDMRFGTPFSLTLKVQDSLGNPVKGLQVSAYNLAVDSVLAKKSITAGTGATTTVSFAVSKSSFIDLTVYNLDGSTAATVVHQTHDAGYYSCLLNFQDIQAGTRVYKAVITAVDDSSSKELFRDSVYLTMWRQDPAMSILGYTSASGTFGTGDSIAFPNILTLPALMRTTETGTEPLYVFTIPNEVVFTLCDTLHEVGMRVVKTIQRGKNEFVIQWNPEAGYKTSAIVKQPIPGIVKKDIIPLPVNFRLYQNYPNPFH